LAAIKNLNRLEGIGEALRAALDELATVAPDWLQEWVPVEWFERYGRAIDEYRLPKGIAARQEYAERVGSDGMTLLKTVWDDSAPLYLRQLPFIEYLRKTWVHQFYVENGQVKLRAATDLPPAGERADSPYDPDARYGNKRSTTWTGYKVHLTETCDEGQVHLITHVMTTPGHQSDIDQTEFIHAALKAKSLLPSEHIVDAGYVDASLVLTSLQRYGVELLGPMRPKGSWQTKTPGGYSLEQFAINWKTKRVTCPQGKKSKSWTPTKDAWNNAIIYIKFSRTDCRLCPARSLCTRSATESRSLTIRPQAEHQALQNVRQQQKTEDWQTRYNRRAGIEGTLSQGVNALGLRRCRYQNLAKTHLQHLLTGSAINIIRIGAWLRDQPHAKTRFSPFASLAPTKVG
jgi:transposase